VTQGGLLRPLASVAACWTLKPTPNPPRRTSFLLKPDGVQANASQGGGAVAENGIGDNVFGGFERGVVFVAKAEIEGEGGFDFPVVLEEEGGDGETQVFGVVGGFAGNGIEGAGFLVGSVVGETPEIAEAEGGAGGAGGAVEDAHAGEVAAEFEEVAAASEGERVTDIPGALIEDAGAGGAEALDGDGAEGVGDGLGHAPGLVGVGLCFVELPAAQAEAGFVDHGGR
jgi:hypothetical protein